jgi:arsenate reductase
VPDAHVVKYLDEPLDREAVLQLLAALEDSPSDLVRRDPLFHELGLTNADVESAEQVADLLSAHPQLMERPVIIRGNAAIIGRPTERIAAFLAD